MAELCLRPRRQAYYFERVGSLTSTAPQYLFNFRDTSVDGFERRTHQAKLLREGHAEHFGCGKGNVCPVC